MSDDPRAAADELLGELHDLFGELETHARNAHPEHQDELTYGQTIAFGLFVAAFELYLGVAVLLRSRYAEEARILHRALLDDAAMLAWLAEVPAEFEERALRFARNSLGKERAIAERAQGFHPPLPWARGELERLAKERRKLEKRAREGGFVLEPLPSFHQIVAILADPRLSIDYDLGSQSAHSGRIALDARMLEGEDGQMVITLQAPPRLVGEIGVKVLQVFSSLLIDVCELLGWDTYEDAIRYRTGLIPRSEKLYFELKGEPDAP